MLAIQYVSNIIGTMPRRVKQTRSFLTPLAENFARRLAGTDQRLRRRIVAYLSFVLALGFAYSLMAGMYSLPRIVRLELERKSLLSINRELSAEVIDADRIRQMLLTDPGYIEYIARTKYRMARPNETIYRYRGQ